LALIDAGNADAVRKAAHAVKGAARTACATRLADLRDDLESTAKLPDWAEISRLGPLIDAEVRRVMAFMEQYLRQPD